MGGNGNGPRGTEEIPEKSGEMGRNFEERQARFANAEGLKLRGDFEQRRAGWDKAGNKAACFECGNTDRFKEKRPFWKSKKRNGPMKTQPPTQHPKPKGVEANGQ